MRRPAVLAVIAALATVALVVGGLLLRDDPDEGASAAPTSEPFRATPLASYDTSRVTVTRGAFCDAVDDRLVDATLGSVPDPRSWANGDTVDLGNGAEDVVHEFGCSYAVPGVGEARAWVFAPPVDAATAQGLVESAGKGAGCVASDGPPFGSPTLALTCTRGGTERASYRGLFGDAWVVCEVVRAAGATYDTVDVAGRWCVGVLKAAHAG